MKELRISGYWNKMQSRILRHKMREYVVNGINSGKWTNYYVAYSNIYT